MNNIQFLTITHKFIYYENETTIINYVAIAL